MEHNAIQWVGAPSCQRGSYAFYKSVSSRADSGGPVRLWRLGEFYFIRCGPDEPVCIAEVTLLWEDQARRHLLASARLYFLPEDTPKGRTRDHGEDEVLAVSRKMVVRVEDLVRWSCAEPPGWNTGPNQPPSNGLPLPAGGDTADDGVHLLTVKTEDDLTPDQFVKVVSYPQYCRFRSLQRRIQDGARGPELEDPHLLALGGIRALPEARVLYCRDTFTHPTLESSACFSWQFECPSLSLRGRPRKRRGRDGRDPQSPDQSESWIERMKENVMGSVEFGCEGSWLPHPEEQLFLDQLFDFMERRGSPIHKVPNLGFKKIDLFLMYSVVKKLGGYRKVTSERLWKVVYNELGGCPGSTSAATCTRRHYERLMLPYEEHLRVGGTEFKIPDIPITSKPRGIRGRKPLPRGRRPGPKPKDKKDACPGSPTPPILNPNGLVEGKRGRGRPPGTRNKSTLIAQAKLLAQSQVKAKAGADLMQPSPLLSPAGRGAPIPSSLHRPIQPAIIPLNMPLTPDLSPLSPSFLPFTSKDVKPDSGPAPSGVLLSALPRFVGGSLGGFSPIKGVCPLDVFRSSISLQRGADSPALTPQDPAQLRPAIFTLQPKSGSPDTPRAGGDQPPQHQHPNHCSGCNTEEGGHRGAGRDSRPRPPLPPLRVLPLNVDCSVQVCQLMRTRHLDSSQLQSFTRRLSEALSQDLSAKPPPSPMTPPPEQALPLNLSKRFAPKRAEGPEASRQTANGSSEPSSKRPRSSFQDQAQDFSLAGRSGSIGGVGAPETKNQEEPADLSSPSRIRAFLLGLPPFQVKLEEDLNGSRFGKFSCPAESETARTETGQGAAARTETKEEAGRALEEAQGPLEEALNPVLLSPLELTGAGPSNTHCV